MSFNDVTLVVIKPDALEQGLESKIKMELESEGLCVSEIGCVRFDLCFVQKFYQWVRVEHSEAIEGYLCAGSMPVWVIRGDCAVEKTLSVKSRLRREFCVGRLKTLFHCPCSVAEFNWEYKLLKERCVTMNEKKERTKNQVEVILFKQIADNMFLFLLLKRNLQKGGFWQPVTGNVEVGESFEKAAARELQEETGINPVLELVDIGYFFNFVDHGMEQFERVFGARVSCEQEVKLSSEHTEYIWVSLTEALNSYLKYPGNKEGFRRLHQELTQGHGRKEKGG